MRGPVGGEEIDIHNAFAASLEDEELFFCVIAMNPNCNRG